MGKQSTGKKNVKQISLMINNFYWVTNKIAWRLFRLIINDMFNLFVFRKINI